MSKSLGNVVLAHDLLKDWPGEVIRWALLSAHYRQPLEWTEELLRQSKKQLDRFYRLLEELEVGDDNEPVPQSTLNALWDDLNTPDAIADLHEIKEIASHNFGDLRVRAIRALRRSGRLMGFFHVDPEQWFRGIATDGPSADEIEALLQERLEARKSKNFARADEIRDMLAVKGIVIEDGPQGATWRKE